MVEKVEDIIYYEEPADDGTMWYRCDYRGVAIRKPKAMFEGGEKIHIQEEFFRHIHQENLYDIFNVDPNAKKVTTEEI
tara:strand:- start:779 stop:1012 length:234 start_codon:yes stop_codon:yes gene_type:complete